jgi:hypothetical protein
MKIKDFKEKTMAIHRIRDSNDMSSSKMEFFPDRRKSFDT